MGCTPAPTCRAALTQATELWPNRNKASDGICPSAAHTAQNPNSDHEPGNAWDLTDDPGAGCDTAQITRQIVGRRDPRVKYVICDRMIYGPGSGGGWAGKAYTGKNPHTSHMHVSIYEHARNDTSPWFPGATGGAPPGGTTGDIDKSDLFGLGLGLGVDQAVETATGPLEQLTAFFGFITDPSNWMRAVTFLAGLTMAVVGVVMLVADTRVARVAADAVVKAKSGGTIDTDFAEGDVMPKLGEGVQTDASAV